MNLMFLKSLVKILYYHEVRDVELLSFIMNTWHAQITGINIWNVQVWGIQTQLKLIKIYIIWVLWFNKFLYDYTTLQLKNDNLIIEPYLRNFILFFINKDNLKGQHKALSENWSCDINSIDVE